jgi:hypothetical protein
VSKEKEKALFDLKLQGLPFLVSVNNVGSQMCAQLVCFIFSDENNFRKNIFFFVFGYNPKNTSKNILHVKDKAKGVG